MLANVFLVCTFALLYLFSYSTGVKTAFNGALKSNDRGPNGENVPSYTTHQERSNRHFPKNVLLRLIRDI